MQAERSLRLAEDPPRTVLLRGIAELWDGERRWSDAAVLLDGARVAWVGADVDRPHADAIWDAGGAVAMPGLIDCHTHTTFAGSRAADFERRLAGESYADILLAGGGIHSTVRATRGADLATLTALTRARLADMLLGGVTTVEVKSGYGLTAASEVRMLQAARAAAGPVDVSTTFLAHVPPVDVPRGDVLRLILDEQLPACAPWCDAVDVFCDRGAFTLDEAVAILRRAQGLGKHIRVHAEQIEATGIAAAAAAMGALSADHLERLDEEGIAAMAAAGTVAVLLPGAMLYLRDPCPPVRQLRAAGVPMAVATDFNPGSSPVRDLWAAASLACVSMGLTVSEALAGVTRHAAAAIGRPSFGRLQAGSPADIALFHPPPGEPAELRVLVQYMGGHKATLVVKGGAAVVGGREAAFPVMTVP